MSIITMSMSISIEVDDCLRMVLPHDISVWHNCIDNELTIALNRLSRVKHWHSKVWRNKRCTYYNKMFYFIINIYRTWHLDVVVIMGTVLSIMWGGARKTTSYLYTTFARTPRDPVYWWCQWLYCVFGWSMCRYI